MQKVIYGDALSKKVNWIHNLSLETFPHLHTRLLWLEMYWKMHLMQLLKITWAKQQRIENKGKKKLWKILCKLEIRISWGLFNLKWLQILQGDFITARTGRCFYGPRRPKMITFFYWFRQNVLIYKCQGYRAKLDKYHIDLRMHRTLHMYMT